MLELLSEPLIQRAGTGDCQPNAAAGFCWPCRQEEEYIPKLVVSQNAVAFERLARSVLQLDDLLMAEVCKTPCLTWDTDDCECLLAFGRAIGVPPSYQLTEADYCLQTWGRLTLSQCVEHDVKIYCPPVCSECVLVKLDCEDPDDRAIFKKLLKLKAVWSRKPATRENINGAINEWYGEGAVVGSKEGVIYWGLGRSATYEERAFMPFLQTFFPVSPFADIAYTEPIDDRPNP